MGRSQITVHGEAACCPQTIPSARSWWKVFSQTQSIVSLVRTEGRELRRKVSFMQTGSRELRSKTTIQIGLRTESEIKNTKRGQSKIGIARERKTSNGSSSSGCGGTCYLCQLTRTSTDSHHSSVSISHNLQDPSSYSSSDHHTQNRVQNHQTINPPPHVRTFSIPSHTDPQSTDLAYPIDASPSEIVHYPTSKTEKRKGRIFGFLPIARSQPPLPPQRTSSLRSHREGKAVERFQSRPLTLQRNPTGMGRCDFGILQDLKTWTSEMSGVTHGNGSGSGNGVWDLVLKAAWEEDWIARLLNVGSDSESNRQLLPGLPSQLARISKEDNLDARTLEIVLTAVYLHTYSCISLGRNMEAKRWMRYGYQVLKTMVRECGGEEKLPGSIRALLRDGFGKLSFS